MILRVIHEKEQTACLREKLHDLDSEQLFFIERACRIQRAKRKQDVFHQWQDFLQSELAHHSPKQ